MSKKLKNIAQKIEDTIQSENMQGIYDKVKNLAKEFEHYFGILNQYELVKLTIYIYYLKRGSIESGDKSINNLYLFNTLEYMENDFAMERCEECDGDGYVECGQCEGRGTSTCHECEGEGEVDCQVCEGSGEEIDDEGHEVECENCDGDGKERCENCYGEGTENCDECSGNGSVECGECNGDGEIESSNLSVEITCYISFDSENKKAVYYSYELNKPLEMQGEEFQDEFVPNTLIYKKYHEALELQNWVEPEKVYVYEFWDSKDDFHHLIPSLPLFTPNKPFTF